MSKSNETTPNVPTLRFSNKTIWEKKRIKDFCEVNPKTEELEDEFIYIDLESVTFKSNISDKTIQGQLVVDDTGYTPINNFTTVELGCEKGNVISTTIVKDQSLAQTLIRDFNEIWNDKKVLQEVTDEVVESITAAY